MDAKLREWGKIQGRCTEDPDHMERRFSCATRLATSPTEACWTLPFAASLPHAHLIPKHGIGQQAEHHSRWQQAKACGCEVIVSDCGEKATKQARYCNDETQNYEPARQGMSAVRILCFFVCHINLRCPTYINQQLCRDIGYEHEICQRIEVGGFAAIQELVMRFSI